MVVAAIDLLLELARIRSWWPVLRAQLVSLLSGKVVEVVDNCLLDIESIVGDVE